MSSIKLVVNTSPIISLAQIGHADLLVEMCSELVIPQGVFEEITIYNLDDPAVRWVREKEVYVRSVNVPISIAEWNLGKGESEVLSFAFGKRDFVSAIDDRAAKRCAASLDIKVRGTVALIIEAKRNRLVSEARPLFLKLKANGFRISQSVLDEALRLAGEAAR